MTAIGHTIAAELNFFDKVALVSGWTHYCNTRKVETLFNLYEIEAPNNQQVLQGRIDRLNETYFGSAAAEEYLSICYRVVKLIHGVALWILGCLKSISNRKNFEDRLHNMEKKYQGLSDFRIAPKATSSQIVIEKKEDRLDQGLNLENETQQNEMAFKYKRKELACKDRDSLGEANGLNLSQDLYSESSMNTLQKKHITQITVSWMLETCETQIIPVFQHKNDPVPLMENRKNIFSKVRIARDLCLEPDVPICDKMEKNVNAVAAYLEKEGFELVGVKSDGNCFFHAFLKSYATLTRIIPLLDVQEDKIAYLRKCTAKKYRLAQTDFERSIRADEIEKNAQWISAQGEGDLLANALEIPIRIVTAMQDSGACEINDMLTFIQDGKEQQVWDTIDESERPKEYILIVDLGGHFISAQPFYLREAEEF